MYKIYINDTPLILANLKSIKAVPKSDEQTMVARYTGMAKSLLNYIDMLEKSKRFNTVYLLSENYAQLVADFEKHFKLIEAAGGVVYNTQARILAIFRRGSWDLPKGKIDPGETPPIAAVREVQEETGIQQIELGKLIGSTYHTYRLKSGKRVLKRTYWYKMQTNDMDLKPQTEEDIEQALWIGPKAFLNGNYPMYNSIREVVEQCI